jgi:hypothetical protein
MADFGQQRVRIGIYPVRIFSGAQVPPEYPTSIGVLKTSSHADGLGTTQGPERYRAIIPAKYALAATEHRDESSN